MKDRLWQIGFMLSILAAFVIGGVVAQSPQVQVLLRGQKIELTDSSGKVLGLMAPDSSGNGSITLYDKAGNVIWQSSASKTANQPANEPSREAKPKLTLNYANWGRNEYGGVCIQGRITNDSDIHCEFASVSINLYGPGGVKVGDTLANTANLEPHGLWDFECVVIEKNAQTFKVMTIESR